jgi:hypothetical protein
MGRDTRLLEFGVRAGLKTAGKEFGAGMKKGKRMRIEEVPQWVLSALKCLQGINKMFPVPRCRLKALTGDRRPGTGNRELGTGNRLNGFFLLTGSFSGTIKKYAR